MERDQVASDLVHGSSDAAFAIDAHARIVAWNHRAQEVLGYTSQEVMGRPCWEVVRGVTRDGRAVCTPGCIACKVFHQGYPFQATNLICRGKEDSPLVVDLATVVLSSRPAPGEVQALVFLRSPRRADVQGDAPSLPRHLVLRAYLLGPFQLYLGDIHIHHTSWRRKQAIVLLKRLLVQTGRPVHREALVEALWPDASAETGIGRLKVLVHFLRQQLTQAGGGVAEGIVQRDGECYFLDAGRVWVDANAFEQLALEGNRLFQSGRLQEALTCYQQADVLYRGDYLADEPYSDWCLLERERLREQHISLLESLASVRGARAAGGGRLGAAHLAAGEPRQSPPPARAPGGLGWRVPQGHCRGAWA